MANGINDILSVYRQSVASERQTRVAEMQMSLQSLQNQAEMRFQEEGRKRENTLFALKHAEDRTKEAIGKDAGMVVAGLTGLMKFSDKQELYDFKKQDRLHDSGMSTQDQITAYTIVSMYASDSEALQKLGRQTAIGFSRRFANEWKVWAASGFSELTEKRDGAEYPIYKGSLLSGLESADLVYLGEDEMRRELSVEPYLMVSSATDAIDRINKEYDEIGMGDYGIQRDLSYTADVDVAYEGAELDAETLKMMEELAKEADLQADKPAKELAEMDLKEYKHDLQGQSINTSFQMRDEQLALDDLGKRKENINFFITSGSMTKTDGDKLLMDLNKSIKGHEDVLDSLSVLTEDLRAKRIKVKAEEKRRYGKYYEEYGAAEGFVRVRHPDWQVGR